jgi:hypothetical protein
MLNQIPMKPVYCLLGCLAFGRLSGSATIIDIDTQATYLRTQEDFGNERGTGNPYTARDTIPIDLVSLGFAPGDQVSMARIGSYRYWPRSVGALDEALGMVAVFSSTADLLANSNLNRVAGALDAGADVWTGDTFYGGLTTDISEDFDIPGSGVVAEIPLGAKYLFVSAADILFWDNQPGPDGFKLSISKHSASVPEAPQTLVLTGLALVAVRLADRVWGRCQCR